MDLLTDTLNLAGLRSRVLNQRHFPSQTTVHFPCARSLGFHVVLKGTAYLHTKNQKTPRVLERGDIALMARGSDHSLSTEAKPSKRVQKLGEFQNSEDGATAPLTLVSGAYQLWNDPIHPFLNELPDWFILKKDDLAIDEGLHQVMDLLGREVSKNKLGSERIIQSLLDVMFSMIMRKVIEKVGADESNWAHSTQKTGVRKALELLHSDLRRDWRLEDLAKDVGVSRSGLASQFKKFTGDSPLHYLTTLRIQKAMTLLTSSDDGIEKIAFEVGYKDSFTFSKSFKRLAGVSPRDFRRRHLSGASAAF